MSISEIAINENVKVKKLIAPSKEEMKEKIKINMWIEKLKAMPDIREEKLKDYDELKDIDYCSLVEKMSEEML